MAILIIFFSLLAIKKTFKKSLDFRISKFAFLVSGETKKKGEVGCCCCCDKTVAATVEEDSDIIVAKEEGKQSKQESKQASTLKS
jgi:hypothetical protein